MLTELTTWHQLAPALVSEHLARTGPGPVVEVGVWRGELSEKLLGISALTHLVMVDPWIATYLRDAYGNWYVNGPGETQEEMEASYRLAADVATRAHGRARIIREPSVSAAAQIKDGSLAAVIIDAQHFRDQVMEDIYAWAPKLRPDGLMIGDDYSEYYPGVQAGVEAVFGDQYKVLGQTWWTYPHPGG